MVLVLFMVIQILHVPCEAEMITDSELKPLAMKARVSHRLRGADAASKASGIAD